MRIRVSISPGETVSRICNEITQAVESIFSSRTYAENDPRRGILAFSHGYDVYLNDNTCMGRIRHSRSSRFALLSPVDGKKIRRREVK